MYSSPIARSLARATKGVAFPLFLISTTSSMAFNLRNVRESNTEEIRKLNSQIFTLQQLIDSYKSGHPPSEQHIYQQLKYVDLIKDTEQGHGQDEKEPETTNNEKTYLNNEKNDLAKQPESSSSDSLTTIGETSTTASTAPKPRARTLRPKEES